jgi:sugar lactone lactonase YvrE
VIPWEAMVPGPLPPSKSLASAEKIFDGNIYLPEATVVGSDGSFFVSSGNGSILRIDKASRSYSMEVHTGGRPLGMKFCKNGRLLVADALLGLLSVDLATKTVEILCNFAEGKPVRFANAVEVATDGTIYFTDSTDIAPLQETTGYYNTHHSAVVSLIAANPTGRIIKVNPTTKEVSVIESHLSFANGLALSSDESYLIVSDLGHNSICRIWLKGPKQGQKETIFENLPGFPDNIQRASDGGFWIALASQRSALIDFLHPYPILKKLLLKIPMSIFPKPPPLAQVLKVSPSLKIEYMLRDDSGHLPVVTDAFEYNGKLYLAAVNAFYWAVYDL